MWQMLQYQEELLVCQITVLPTRGTWMSWWNGLRGVTWFFTRGNFKSCIWGKIIPGNSPRSWLAGKPLCREGPEDPGGQADHKPVTCPSWQKKPPGFWAALGRIFPSDWRRWSFIYLTLVRLRLNCEFWALQYNRELNRLSPAKDTKGDEGTGASFIWGKAERTRTVHPGAEKAWGWGDFLFVMLQYFQINPNSALRIIQNTFITHSELILIIFLLENITEMFSI